MCICSLTMIVTILAAPRERYPCIFVTGKITHMICMFDPLNLMKKGNPDSSQD